MEPTLWSSASGFLIAWIAAGISLLLLLAGRYGEMKDIGTVHGHDLRPPPRWVFNLAALVCFVGAAFWVFHEDRVAHWRESTNLRKEIDGYSQRVAELETLVNQSSSLVESVNTSRSVDIAALSAAYQGQVASEKRLLQATQEKHDQAILTADAEIADLRSRLNRIDQVRWVRQEVPNQSHEGEPVRVEEVYIYPSSKSYSPALIEVSCECELIDSQIFLLGKRDGFVSWGEKLFSPDRTSASFQINSPAIDNAYMFRFILVSRTPISDIRADVREGKL